MCTDSKRRFTLRYDDFGYVDPYPNGRRTLRCWLDVDGTYHEEVVEEKWTIKKEGKPKEDND